MIALGRCASRPRRFTVPERSGKQIEFESARHSSGGSRVPATPYGAATIDGDTVAPYLWSDHMSARPARRASGRERRARGSISSAEVIRGALELLETEPADALSMNQLAQHLDVGVTSIYWYFKSKEDLMDALTEEAFKRFYGQMPPIASKKWDDVLREFFTNFRNILRNDNALWDLTIMRGGNYTDETRILSWTKIEEILEVLVDAGFSPDSATYVYFTLSVYTRGSLFLERMTRSRGVDPAAYRHPRLELVDGMPVLSREVRIHSWTMVSDDDFEFGIENNLRGFRALLSAERRAAKAGADART
jgi:AcrR family transcriptional regulator